MIVLGRLLAHPGVRLRLGRPVLRRAVVAPSRRPKDVPADAYATAGNRGQYTIVVPSHERVVVRRGLDRRPRQHSFPRWDLTREVLKAFPRRPGGAKPEVQP